MNGIWIQVQLFLFLINNRWHSNPTIIQETHRHVPSYWVTPTHRSGCSHWYADNGCAASVVGLPIVMFSSVMFPRVNTRHMSSYCVEFGICATVQRALNECAGDVQMSCYYRNALYKYWLNNYQTSLTLELEVLLSVRFKSNVVCVSYNLWVTVGSEFGREALWVGFGCEGKLCKKNRSLIHSWEVF